MDRHLAQLEDVLAQQIAAQERLLALLKQKVEAFRAARPRQMAECCRRENDQVQLIGELEKRRLMLVAALTQATDPRAAAPLPLGELAQRLAEPARGRLLLLRQQWRGRMDEVKRQGSIARRAAESLLRHMQGLVQSIGGALTGIGTYGKRGSPPPMATAVSTFSATA